NKDFLCLTPVARLACSTITEQAMRAMACIVKEPCWKPAANGACAVNLSPTALTGFDMYIIIGVPTSSNIEINKSGVKPLPILSAKVPGLQLNANTIMKNISENTNSAIVLGESRNGIRLISYAVVAVLGIAK